MFRATFFHPDWIHQQRRQLGNCDPAILEKCVHALTLLGYLTESGLPFIFKGGTSLLLHMPEVRRLSRDIDIVCGRPAADVDAVVKTIGARAPFLRWQEDDRVGVFNAAFQIAAGQLADRATELLRDFDPDIGIIFVREQDADFTWWPKKLTSPRFVAEATRPNRALVTDYHEVFNEARLSAMAICLFFAALETCPIEGPRLLVLDDVLIGLDMGNRRKVINLVQRLFSDCQIIILTYHKAWFEVLKARIRVGPWGGHGWRSIVLRPERHRQGQPPAAPAAP